MDYCVDIFGYPELPDGVADMHRQSLAAAGLPLELRLHRLAPDGLHEQLAALGADEQCLGGALYRPFSRAALAYCQHASPAALSTGLADTLLRRRDGTLQADCTGVAAFIDALHDAGVISARTALVLGGGNLARIALAGLKELGCQRALIGYRHPRRPSELSSLFKHQRRNYSYFPMAEMQDFFAWADSEGLFASRSQVPPPDNLPGRKKKDDQSFKRWDILIQATPIGLRPEEEPLVSNDSFLRCFSFVYDLVPSAAPTTLTRLAHESGVPALTGHSLLLRQAELARQQWTAQYRRIQAGEPDPPLEFPAEARGDGRGQRRGGWSRRPESGSREGGSGRGPDRDGGGDKARFVVKRRGS